MVITSNHCSSYDIGEFDFNDVADAYYIVIDDKPFESQWGIFKVACKEKFIRPHIIFITPLIINPEFVENFLSSYLIMIGVKNSEDMRIYD